MLVALTASIVLANFPDGTLSVVQQTTLLCALLCAAHTSEHAQQCYKT